jgi:tetratricopeptide (TPR) repeat protein
MTGAAQRRPDLAAAIQLHADGRLDEACEIYQRLHAADHGDSEVLFLMGVLCCDLGLFEAAIRFLEQALLHCPAFPEARGQLAAALRGLAESPAAAGDPPQAQRLLERALGAAPDDAATLAALGRVALQRGDAAGAERWLLASLAHRPMHAQTLNWLGLARMKLENYAAAEQPLRQALDIQPELNQARNNLGLVIYRSGRLAEALSCFEEAIARDPEYRNARINRASTLRTLGRYAEAQEELERVLARHPDDAEGFTNLGAVLQDRGKPDLALAALNRAAALSPESPTTRWNLALTQLLLGDFTRGFENFEARWEGCEHLRGGYRMPRERAWRGESLAGKRLLLWSEQGFGDTIQFIRFAQDAARRGATVTALVQPQLTELVRSAPGIAQAGPCDGPVPPYDVHCPLMSLPHLLGISDTDQLHGTHAYLRAPPERTEGWRQRMQAGSGLKVGLTWKGSSRTAIAELAAIDARRSVALELWAPLLAVRGCAFFSLQKDVTAAEADALARAGIRDFSAEWRDFADTAAVVANLDLVISVDTAVAHLAGAMGAPVWLLNRYDSCWRWLQGRADSPWYPRLRQFRQERPGEWHAVIADAAAALAQQLHY